MAITASDLIKPADVKIGGDLVVGNYLTVPAGQTWEIDGDVKIVGELRIEDGATLALTGADRAAASGQQQRRITVGDAVRYLAGGDGGHQQIVLRAPAEGDPAQLERLRAQIEQYELETEPTDAKRQNLERLRRAAFDAEPTDADRQRLERLKAAADRFAMGVSPEEAQRLRAQIDHPFLLSPDEAKRAAAQFTSLMAPTALEGYAAEFMRPPHPKEAIASADLAAWTSPVALAMAENLRQMVEPVMLSAGRNFAEILMQAAEPAMISLAQQIQYAAEKATLKEFISQVAGMAEQNKQMMAAINGLAWPGQNIARQMVEPSKQAMAAINSLTRPQQTTIDAMGDLDRVRIALRNSGYSLGLLDDTDRALDRLYEQRQAPPARRPEPPAERVQVVHLGDEVLLAELDRRLRVNSLSSEAKRSMARLLHAYTGRGKPGPQEPPMETKVKLIEDYERLRDRKRITQDAYVAHYAHKILAVSLRTFQSYIKEVRLWRESLDDTE